MYSRLYFSLLINYVRKNTQLTEIVPVKKTLYAVFITTNQNTYVDNFNHKIQIKKSKMSNHGQGKKSAFIRFKLLCVMNHLYLKNY